MALCRERTAAASGVGSPAARQRRPAGQRHAQEAAGVHPADVAPASAGPASRSVLPRSAIRSISAPTRLPSLDERRRPVGLVLGEAERAESVRRTSAAGTSRNSAAMRFDVRCGRTIAARPPTCGSSSSVARATSSSRCSTGTSTPQRSDVAPHPQRVRGPPHLLHRLHQLLLHALVPRAESGAAPTRPIAGSVAGSMSKP